MKPFAFKVYDPNMSGEKRSDYWDKKMEELYFTHPELLIQILSKSCALSFINQFLPEEGLILDGGCGSNFLAKMLDTEKRKIVGLDFAISNLTKGKDVYQDVYAVGGDLNRLPFKDDSFDAILSASTAEHIERGPQLLFEETRRVLKDERVFLCIMPTYNLEDLIVDKVGGPFAKRNDGLRETTHMESKMLYKPVKTIEEEGRDGFFAYWFSRRSIERMLKDAGFSVEKSFSLDILGGMARSRFLGGYSRELQKKTIVSMMQRAPDIKESWFEKIFMQEEIYDCWFNRLIHNSASALYRYVLAFVCINNRSRSKFAP